MSFYNDECDLVDDDQYDFFTSTSFLQRHSEQLDGNISHSSQGIGVERRSTSHYKSKGRRRPH